MVYPTSYMIPDLVYSDDMYSVKKPMKLLITGLLKFSAGNLLPEASSDECMLSSVPGEHCFDAGKFCALNYPILFLTFTKYLYHNNKLYKHWKSHNWEILEYKLNQTHQK